MHDLKANFDKFHRPTKEFLSEELNDEGNTQNYLHRPKMPDSTIIALSLSQEALGIDSEHNFHGKLKSDHGEKFRDLVHLTRYNERRKRPSVHIQLMNTRMAEQMMNTRNKRLANRLKQALAP